MAAHNNGSVMPYNIIEINAHDKHFNLHTCNYCGVLVKAGKLAKHQYNCRNLHRSGHHIRLPYGKVIICS